MAAKKKTKAPAKGSRRAASEPAKKKATKKKTGKARPSKVSEVNGPPPLSLGDDGAWALAAESSQRTNGTIRTKPKRRSAPAGSRARNSGASKATDCGKYVYCLIRSANGLSFGGIGIGAEPAEVHTVNYRNIAAVVSDAPIEVYDPTRENVLAHQHVNETVMRDHTVIPMSFGTVFKTGEDIIELLRSAYDAFQDVLMKMENKVEFGLKVLWDPEVATALIEQEDEGIRRLKEEISSRKGSTYFARVQYGRLVDARLSERSERYLKEIFEALRDVSVASRTNKPIGDRMIMNAAFLVDRARESEFDARLKKVGKQYSDLTFRYTGPWPPYNFVNIRLKLERVEEDR